MKYHEISPAPKLSVRRSTIPAMLESAGLLDKMEQAGWVRPIVKAEKNGGTDLFLVADIQAALNRLNREQLPA